MIDELDVKSQSAAEHSLPVRGPRYLNRFQRRKLAVIVATLVAGLAVRVYKLDAAGLAEDEANKIFAVRSYLQGDFSMNSEHPMLMKVLCLASIESCRAWNDTVGVKVGAVISEETSLRLPNAIFGALTVVPLFLLANALFGFRVASITACLWALGGNAIWFNRVTKEDTLLVFFMLSGYAIYNSAKTRPASDVRGQERLYGLAGAAFGLMMASKYFPHYYGLMALFYHLGGYDGRDNRPLTRRMKTIHCSAILFTFLAFNFAILLPGTWVYLWQYVHGDFFTHHGYAIMGQVYPNSIARTPNGSPWFFYWLYGLVKLPLPVIAASLIGIVVVFTNRKSGSGARGHLFLRIMLIFWLFPMTFMGVKFLRYTLEVIPVIYMTAAIGAVAAWRLGVNGVKAFRGPIRDLGRAARITNGLAHSISAAVLVIFVLWPAATAITHLPYPGLYTNCIGGGRVGYFFPHDEFYDLGARESIRYIAEHAANGAVVATEIPAVLQYYLERYGRSDIRSEVTSHPGFTLASPLPDYVLMQPGRVYFENLEQAARVESAFEIAQSSTYGGVAATRLYKSQNACPGASSGGR